MYKYVEGRALTKGSEIVRLCVLTSSSMVDVTFNSGGADALRSMNVLRFGIDACRRRENWSSRKTSRRFK